MKSDEERTAWHTLLMENSTNDARQLRRPACRIPVWMAQGALDETVDWRYNIEFIRTKFRLQTLLMLEEGSHHLINERADIRAALTGLIPAFLHAKQYGNYY